MIEITYLKSKNKKDKRFKIKRNGKEKVVKIKGKTDLLELLKHAGDLKH